MTTFDHNEWLKPISEEAPCGSNLEYDPEYAVLVAKMTTRNEAQYGDFVDKPEPPNWTEMERECRRMLLRTRDISMLILLMRCRARTTQAKGFLESLSLLWALLEAYPEQINPQLTIDGEYDPAVRANALATLVDPDGLLGDIREIVLVKSTAFRLQVRDVERAFAVPRPSDALAPDSVIRQLQEMVINADNAVQSMMQAANIVHAIDEWAHKTLQVDAPDLSALIKVLDLFQQPELLAYCVPEDTENFDQENHPEQAEETPTNEASVESDFGKQEITDVNTESVPVNIVETASPTKRSKHLSSDPRVGRKQALEDIRRVRLWFEQHEPSSPVSVLLKQAERTVGKRFVDVAQSIPSELLLQWEQTDDSE